MKRRFQVDDRGRLDNALVHLGAFASRARAQAAIKAGCVAKNGSLIKKTSVNVISGDVIDVVGDAYPYVSRGGVKLEAVLQHFSVDASQKTCLDLGASTGGFSDVLLRAGAARIFAVDVGSGQLDPSIANDPRVVNLEKTNARALSRMLIPEALDIIVCDVSFISLKLVLPPALPLAGSRARLVALVKPQFEVGKSRLGKGGIVKPGYENAEGVAEDMAAWITSQAGWRSDGFIESPITGGDGNREFLLAATRED
ncbi:MAG: TlyA family RNA methyltransferase [Pseudomonadota bacterium]